MKKKKKGVTGTRNRKKKIGTEPSPQSEVKTNEGDGLEENLCRPNRSHGLEEKNSDLWQKLCSNREELEKPEKKKLRPNGSHGLGKRQL